jgi:hypothetical protein
VPVRPVMAESGEIAGTLSGEQAGWGIKLPIDDLLIAVAALRAELCGCDSELAALSGDPWAGDRWAVNALSRAVF